MTSRLLVVCSRHSNKSNNVFESVCCFSVVFLTWIQQRLSFCLDSSLQTYVTLLCVCELIWFALRVQPFNSIVAQWMVTTIFVYPSSCALVGKKRRLHLSWTRFAECTKFACFSALYVFRGCAWGLKIYFELLANTSLIFFYSALERERRRRREKFWIILWKWRKSKNW